jgi:hypothetical protein
MKSTLEHIMAAKNSPSVPLVDEHTRSKSATIQRSLWTARQASLRHKPPHARIKRATQVLAGGIREPSVHRCAPTLQSDLENGPFAAGNCPTVTTLSGNYKVGRGDGHWFVGGDWPAMDRLLRPRRGERLVGMERPAA